MSTDESREIVAAGEDGSTVDMLAAALRADSADLSTYERVLVSTLSGILPDNMIEFERDRSLADRMAGRPGVVRVIRVFLGDMTFELRSVRAALVGTVSKTVRGVTLNRKEATFDEWIGQFATELAHVASQRAEARAALSRFLSGS